MRDVIELHVGVVDDHRTLAEVWPEEVIDVLVYRPGERGPHAAQQDLIQQGGTAAAGKGAGVHLQIRADLEQVIAISRPNVNPLGPAVTRPTLLASPTGIVPAGSPALVGRCEPVWAVAGGACKPRFSPPRAETAVELFDLTFEFLDLLLLGRFLCMGGHRLNPTIRVNASQVVDNACF